MADGRSLAIINQGVTSFRSTQVVWDEADTVLNEGAFLRRVERERFRAQSTSNTIRLSTGAWILKPLNADFFVSHEWTLGQQYAIRLSEFNASPIVVEVPVQRVLSELSGISPAGVVSSSGDYYMTKRITAGNSWAGSLVTGQTVSANDTADYPMDLLLEGTNSGIETPNQGYFLKFLIPGTEMQNPDNCLTFYFGGPLTDQGYGQFALALSGDGRAKLAEFVNGVWVEQHRWSYARPNDVCNRFHAIRIIPHPPQYIEFSAYSRSPFPSQSSIFSEASRYASRDADLDAALTYPHQCNNRGTLGFDQMGILLPSTGNGYLMLEVRRDLRLLWQIQRIAYPASGTITEYGFTVPGLVGSEHLLVIKSYAFDFGFPPNPPVAKSTYDIQNPDTQVSLPISTETYTLGGQSITETGFQLPGDINKCQMVVTMTNSEVAPRYHTGTFYGYEVNRNPNTATVSNGEKTGGILREVSISGPDSDPDHDTALVLISDLTDAVPTLRTRGRIPVRIETQYDPTDATKKSVLFQGYSGRIEPRKRHALGVLYPSQNWHDYSCELMGRWWRLKDTMVGDNKSFLNDRDDPQVSPDMVTGKPWKVTNAIRFMLYRMGFTDAQMDIFDDPIPFFGNPNVSGLSELQTPNPATMYETWLKATAMMYLNAFIVWDQNAGAAGMWRLLRFPGVNATPVWNFVTTPQPAGHLPHKSGAYGANTSPVLGPYPMHPYVIPPEINVLHVVGAPKAFPNLQPGAPPRADVYNRKSFNAPGYTSADPTDLDYLPTIKEYWYNDPTLDTPEAVCFVARRIFNLAARGRKFARFTAELVLFAPTETLAQGGGPVYTTHLKRPLRIGDPVTLDGVNYVTRSCNPHYRKDTIQLAQYELELTRTDLTYG